MIKVTQIAIPLPLADAVYSYKVPDDSSFPKEGVRILVPFKNREITGYVVGHDTIEPPKYKIKEYIKILDEEPVLTKNLLLLTKRIAEYYACSWGEAIENALPKWVKHGKSAKKALAKLSPPKTIEPKESPLKLTREQKQSFDHLQQQLDKKNPKPCLLWGVTGSGKSEIYVRLIKEALKKDGASICMVPEIALTEQLKHYFQEHFGESLEILHSGMKDSERFLAWKRIELGYSKVILGPRSAIFAPAPNLKLVIIDEEHENTYKQETTPRYHARQVALERGKLEGALVLLGSATPSLESIYLSQKKELDCLRLTKRVKDLPLPEVYLVDLHQYPHKRNEGLIFSLPLVQEIKKNLANGESTMLLLNRRGFSSFVQSAEEKETMECPSCDIALTYHQTGRKLICHYCNYTLTLDQIKKDPSKKLLLFGGFGTEKVESEAAKLFPTARIARIDTDIMKKEKDADNILNDFRNKKIDILVGTQMIAKGFDFPHVTLVGVILADIGLNLPDFRASERTFQLITQVAGRAGRDNSKGRVVVQTLHAKHPSLTYARAHDVEGFIKHTLPQRHDLCYPPFSKMMNIIVRSKNENNAYKHTLKISEQLGKALKESKAMMMGPAPLPFYRLRGNFRWHIMVKWVGEEDLTSKILSVIQKLRKPANVQQMIDVDPFTIL